MRRLLAVASLWVILAAACSSADDDQADDGPVDGSPTSTESSSPPSTPSSTEPDGADDGADDESDADRPGGSFLQGEDLAERMAELGGQLAIGNGPAVAVARPDGQALQVLGAEAEIAAQPTWSRDGAALAWSSASAARQGVLVQPFDDDGLPEGDAEFSEADGFPVFYLQWSAEDDGLVFLRRASEPGQVEFGFIEPGLPAEPVAQDTPFFVAWAPDSRRVLAHVGQRTVEVHDFEAADDGPREVLDQGDDYSAPVWLDSERALVVADDALAILTLADGGIEPLEPVDGPVRFVLSPDRRRVAFRLLSDRSEGPLTASFGSPSPAASTTERGELVVLDLATGERQVVADEPAAAWEWSPDGSRLAWLSLRTGGRLIGSWNFWSVDGSEPVSSRTPDFGLSRKYAEIYLTFFAQYAQSVTGWAPDSSAFAFAGNIAGDRGVWVQLLDDRAEAQQVTGGDFVTWGPGPTPDPGVGTSAA